MRQSWLQVKLSLSLIAGVKQPSTGGQSKFTAQSSSYKGEGLKALADGKIPTINVVAGDGSGSIALKKDGQRFNMATRKDVISALQFVYTPAGHLQVGTEVQITIPDGWTAPVQDNNDGTDDAGEVSISGKATLGIPSGQIITATTTAVTSDKLTITYKKVTVPDVDPRSDVFKTTMETPPIAAGTGEAPKAAVSPSPTVGIGQVPDGGGTMTVNVTEASAGANLGDLVFTYTAAADMSFGAKVQLAIDPDWPKAIADDGSTPAKAGATTLSGSENADLTITGEGRTLTATLTSAISKGTSLTFTYKNITAPSVAGTHTFGAKSQHTATGTLTALDASPTIDVKVKAAGTVALATTTGPLPAVEPGDALGDLQFTFTAGARMEIGSVRSRLRIPAGWTAASEDNGDAVAAPGEVALGATDPASLEVAASTGGGYAVTATTTGVLLMRTRPSRSPTRE